MSILSPVRRTFPFAAILMAAVLAGCATEEAPPPAPPAPPPPAAAMSPKLIEMASIYSSYVSKALAISPNFTDGQAVAAGLRSGAAYEPEQMTRGAIAYGAIAALQDPAFVAGARAYVGDKARRDQVIYELMKDPAYAVGLPGSDSAAGLVLAALGGDAKKVYDQGKLVRQSAYDIQKSAWSKGDVSGREARLTQAKSLSVTASLPEMSETARLTQAFNGAAPLGLSGAPAAAPYTPMVVRSLAVAALAALGAADDAHLEQVLPLMAETTGKQCMSLAKLNLYQCLAVARPHFEDVFCLGEHVMMDTGRCMMKSVGVALPTEARYIPTADTGRAYVTPPAKKAAVKKAPAKKKS